MTGVELFTIGAMSVNAAQAVMAAGSILQGIAGYKSNQANQKMARYQTDADVERMRREKARMLGQTQVGISKSGVQMEGSPLMVIAENAAEAELDIQTRRWTGQMRENEFERRGKASLIGGAMGAGTSLLTGGFGGGSGTVRGTPRLAADTYNMGTF